MGFFVADQTTALYNTVVFFNQIPTRPATHFSPCFSSSSALILFPCLHCSFLSFFLSYHPLFFNSSNYIQLSLLDARALLDF